MTARILCYTCKHFIELDSIGLVHCKKVHLTPPRIACKYYEEQKEAEKK